ncbi:MAG: hypothetical protein P8M70_06005 [Verrucomicrobiota bacterium]|nr:hypothetical protein [Verrucomicrobiota bacterium]
MSKDNAPVFGDIPIIDDFQVIELFETSSILMSDLARISGRSVSELKKLIQGSTSRIVCGDCK